MGKWGGKCLKKREREESTNYSQRLSGWSSRWTRILWHKLQARPRGHNQIPRKRDQPTHKIRRLGKPMVHHRHPKTFKKILYLVFIFNFSFFIFWMLFFNYLASVISLFTSSAKTTCRQDENLLCNCVDFSQTLGVAYNRNLSLSYT